MKFKSTLVMAAVAVLLPLAAQAQNIAVVNGKAVPKARLLYALTGSQPSDAARGPWTNLGDVVNATEGNTSELLEAIETAAKDVKAGTLVAVVNAMHTVVEVLVEVAEKMGVDRSTLKKLPRRNG